MPKNHKHRQVYDTNKQLQAELASYDVNYAIQVSK